MVDSTDPAPHVASWAARESKFRVDAADHGLPGVPRMSLRLLGGIPLIVHTIEAPMAASEALYRVVVNTDNQKIAALSA